MPWCPRCDETFPQGPACPRCSARLVARERETYEDALSAVPALQQMKVSRRYARAFERLSGPRASSSRALALALVTLVFASGFLLGRIGTLGPGGMGGGPTIRALPAVEPLPFEGPTPAEVEGAISYVITTRAPLATIATQDVFSGDVVPTAQFTPPFDTTEHVTSNVVSYGRSVAVVVSASGEGYVAVAPHGYAPQGWLQGIEAAWMSERDLLIRHVDGSLTKWSYGARSVRSSKLDDADQLLQTAGGPVVRRRATLERVVSPKTTLDLPTSRSKVVAVSPDMTRALLAADKPTLWDGVESVEMTTGTGEILGASFEHSGERAAVSLRTPDGLQLAILDARGNAQLRPLGNGGGCKGAPAWDKFSSWIYVAAGDGVIHAVEAAGGRVEAVKTQSVGCGVAWLDIA